MTIVFALAVAPLGATAQPSRVTDRDVRALLVSMEQNAEQFRRSLVPMPAREISVGWEKARNIDEFVVQFVKAVRRLGVQVRARQVVTAGVDEVLRRGVSIDSFMAHDRSPDQAGRDWTAVRRDLEDLAAAFNVPWNRATPRFTGSTIAPASIQSF
jgi:hypothetical protein